MERRDTLVVTNSTIDSVIAGLSVGDLTESRILWHPWSFVSKGFARPDGLER
jgi:hypothetical protein